MFATNLRPLEEGLQRTVADRLLGLREGSDSAESREGDQHQHESRLHPIARKEGK